MTGIDQRNCSQRKRGRRPVVEVDVEKKAKADPRGDLPAPRWHPSRAGVQADEEHEIGHRQARRRDAKLPEDHGLLAKSAAVWPVITCHATHGSLKSGLNSSMPMSVSSTIAAAVAIAGRTR